MFGAAGGKNVLSLSSRPAGCAIGMAHVARDRATERAERPDLFMSASPIRSIAGKMGRSAGTERPRVRYSERERGGPSGFCSEGRDRLKAPETKTHDLRRCEEVPGALR